jgi:preprotein translocase subunit SecB
MSQNNPTSNPNPNLTPPVAGDEKTPIFQIVKVYLKELSLEQPHSYQTKEAVTEAPEVSVQMDVGYAHIRDALFEVTVTATVHTQAKNETVFLVEAKQAGIFEIRHVPQEHMEPLLGAACPQIIYPYLRASVADTITRAGFPPIHLAEVNFQTMFEQRRAQAVIQAATQVAASGTPETLQ